MAAQSPISLLLFKFDGFEALSTEVGAAAMSGVKIDSKGNAWQMKIHPGGHLPSNAGYCNLHLLYMGKGIVNVAPSVVVRDKHGYVAIEKNYSVTSCSKNTWRSFTNFAHRSAIIANLVERSLTIEVFLQQTHEGMEAFHSPPNPCASKILALLDSGDNADVWFKVGDSIIPAHKLMLQTNAPILARFCEGSNEDSPVLIEGTTPEVFRHVLRYIYGGNAPDEAEMRWKELMIIDAAGKYGVFGLKVAVENFLVASRVINLPNVADYLLFADAKTCPLLKEYATAFFVSRAKDILNSKYSDKLKESPKLLQELILATAENLHTHAHQYAANDTSKMAVDELRKELGKRKLDVDGSKEMLISRLEHANKWQGNESDATV